MIAMETIREEAYLCHECQKPTGSAVEISESGEFVVYICFGCFLMMADVIRRER